MTCEANQLGELLVRNHSILSWQSAIVKRSVARNGKVDVGDGGDCNVGKTPCFLDTCVCFPCISL